MRKDHAHNIIAQVRASYSAIAREFDQTRKQPWKEFEAFLPFVSRGARVLDAGCGNGRLQDFLSSEISHLRYVGVDHNEEMIRLARLNHPGAQFELADIADMRVAPEGRADMEPLSTSSFDAIFCVAAFHHVPGRPLRKKTLHDFHALLKKDGLLVLTVWNLFQWKYRWEWARACLTFLSSLGQQGAWNDLWIKWGNHPLKRYYHAFLPGELRSLLSEKHWKTEDFYFTRKGNRVSFFQSFNLVLVVRKK